MAIITTGGPPASKLNSNSKGSATAPSVYEKRKGAPSGKKALLEWRKAHPAVAKKEDTWKYVEKETERRKAETQQNASRRSNARATVKALAPTGTPTAQRAPGPAYVVSQFRQALTNPTRNPTGEELWMFGQADKDPARLIPTEDKTGRNKDWAPVTQRRGKYLGLVGEDGLRTARNINVGDPLSAAHKAKYPTGVLTDRQFINFVYHLEGPALEVWQKRLFDAGFYNPAAYKRGKPRFGELNDEETVSAWKAAVEQWMQDPSTSITDMLEARSGFGAEKLAETGIAPFVAQLSDPAALNVYADQAGQEILGRAFTAGEKQRFVQFIHGRQTAQQRKAYDAGNASGGSAETTSPDAQAQEFAREIAPGEAGEFDRVKTSNMFYDLLTAQGPTTEKL